MAAKLAKKQLKENHIAIKKIENNKKSLKVIRNPEEPKQF